VPIHYKALATQNPGDHGLRLAFSSASPLDEEIAGGFHQAFSTPIVEVYGSTETGGIATRCRAEGEEAWTSYELVQWKKEKDEFQIASPFLSLNLPKDDQGFAKVADRIQKMDDRRFQLEGRTDQVVKVSGKRVDLAEVEEGIKSIEEIADAHLLATKTESARDQIIVALVVSPLPMESIAKKVKELLPPERVPRSIISVKEIPRTPNGKLDREKVLAIIKSQTR
jgi:acyl-coenzyme A synthetase/AMP-(fatty) acid ligase